MASSDELKTGNSCSAFTHARTMNASGVSLMPSVERFLLELVAGVFEIGDVRFVELRDVRDVHPARVQARTGDLLDARERLRFDRAELREVDRRDAAEGRAPPPPSQRRHRLQGRRR